MDKPYKKSRLMGESQPKEEVIEKDEVVQENEEIVSFEASFFWKDSFNGTIDSSMIVKNDIRGVIDMIESQLEGKQVVGIVPIDESSIQLMIGREG